jgi:hypothetical protein
MPFDTADPTYLDLKARVLAAGARVVPFVGAGLSVYGAPADRLPLWRELIDRLVAEGRRLGLIAEDGDPAIDAALAAGRYVEAMDRVLGALGEPTFKRVVERELDETDKPTPPAIAELVTVGWSLIVTTNLDRLIARAYLERHGRPLDAFTSLDTHRLAAALAGTLTAGDTLLAQIHGALDLYPSWRLTKAHYEQLLQEPGYVEALKQLFLRQIFFVGFGLQDDDLDLLLATVAEIYPAGVGEFYALLPRSRKGDAVVRHLIRENGLRPIFYDVDEPAAPDDPFGGHRAAFECLADLATAWASGERQFDVTLKYFPELDPNVIGRDEEVGALERAVVGQAGAVVQVVGMGGVGKTSLVQQLVASKGGALAKAGYRRAFGCCFYRADIGQFVQDLAVTLTGPLAAPLPEQVERTCDHLARARTLLVLDGIEVLADPDGVVQNPYLSEIVDATIRGRGAVVCTTRIPLRGPMFSGRTIVEVPPLPEDAIRSFLAGWGLDELGDAARRRLMDVTAGHPLALRVLAGVLDDVPASEAVATIERSAVVDIADEIDPLRENRLARVIGSYTRHLDEDQMAFLLTATAFDEPASFQSLESALTRPYPDTSINAPLVGKDLRSTVVGLLDRRLLTISAVGELSNHPTIREYFARLAADRYGDLAPVHRHLASEYLRDAPELAATFSEAKPLVAACRHAAACEDWTLFDDLFRRRLMHGYLVHLCDYLGAWEETLATARLAVDSSFPLEATSDPAYYPLIVARSLKHLGRSAESRTVYLRGLRVAAATRDPESAMYLNNFLTLLIWRGELNAADQVAPLNLGALSWITEDWRRRWQTEHACSSLAYLRLLQGELDQAEALLARSAAAWDDYPGERVWVWDYHPFHGAELTLLRNADAHDEALATIAGLMAECVARAWPEPECRGHVHAAAVHLDRALRRRDPADLLRANERLDSASRITAGISVADVEIAYQVARFKAELIRRELDPSRPLDLELLESVVARLEMLMRTSGLTLAAPEVEAARGLIAVDRGDPVASNASLDRAVSLCEAQGNALALISPRSLVQMLGDRIGRASGTDALHDRADLVRLVESDLAPEEVLQVLAQLDGPDAASAGP